MSEERSYPPEPSAVREVRRFVAEAVAGLPLDRVDAIVLAASELAANSVRHARTPFTVSVERDTRRVRVMVEDEGTGRPQVQDPDPLTPSGRGLLIVARMSDDWGTASSHGRNRVWFSVLTAAAPGAGPRGAFATFRA